MSLFEVLITGPGYLLALGVIGCPLMWIADRIDRPRAEGVAIVAGLALATVTVWLVANRLAGISVPLFIIAYRGVVLCVGVGFISYPLLDVARATGWPWAGNVAIGISIVLVTLGFWLLGNAPVHDDAPALPPGYELPEDWRDWRGPGLPPSKNPSP